MKIQLQVLDSLKNNPFFDTDEKLKAYRDNGPCYGHVGDAGVDLRAVTVEPVELWPGDTSVFDTGLKMWIGGDREDLPEEFTVAGVIVPRSGLGIKQGIVLANLTGIVDISYQGEVKVALWNRTEERKVIMPCDAIAQIMFMPVLTVSFSVVDSFESNTTRGNDGFGSTGR